MDIIQWLKDWCTPTCDELTGIEKNNLGCKLKEDLRKIFGKIVLENYLIQIAPENYQVTSRMQILVTQVHTFYLSEFKLK
jgi:hypothetical protein